MNKTSITRIALICSSLALAATTANATVVSGNNLTSAALPDYTSSGSATSTSFSIGANGLYSISTTVASTATGFNISPYYIAGVSPAASPTSAGQLLGSVYWAGTGGAAYPSSAKSMIFNKMNGASTAYFNLGMGRFDGFGSAGYSWSATGNTLYGSAGTDNNIVPNASFDNTNANFFQTDSLGVAGGTVVTTGGKVGANAWQITSTTNSYLALPVIEGQLYNVSFWYARPVAGTSRFEYGFSTPGNGNTPGTGNTSQFIFVGSGVVGWTEVTASFTPGAGQTTWYLGAETNGGAIQLDSILVAVPEPSTWILSAVGLTVVTIFRRRRIQS